MEVSMNKTKRNLILSAAIINLINMVANLVVAIIYCVNPEYYFETLGTYLILISYYSIYFVFVEVVAGIIASILLIYSVRKKGMYFRTSQKYYIAGLIIVIFAGGWIPWLLLFISMFVPDVIIMNSASEIRHEERAEERGYNEKRKKVEELRKLKEDGLITEEEFNKRLMDLL